MKERYGEPLFRVPIDFNLGCPNRESDGSGGCTFCNARGSAAVQTLGAETVEEQMREAIRFARDRYGAKKYMAYIQAFSATFGERQQPMYLDLLDAFDFTAVSIGTRPDCLTPQAYDFLIELNRHIEVWLELGVQTVHDRTLERINRGHDWASSKQSILKLYDLGIKVAAHVILGLPGESEEDFQETADTLAALPIDAVKIHNLHIEKGTTLALEHALSPVRTFMEHDFAEHLMDFIRRMPSGIPIMRLTTDTLDEELIAPKWHMAKGQFKDYVIQQMICREWRQGDLNPKKNNKERAAEYKSTLKSVETEDGSVTFWNEEYKEHYHTPAGARMEAVEKYIVPSRLEARLQSEDVALLDVCFGLGYNSFAAMNSAAYGLERAHQLNITALEMDRRVVGAAATNVQPSEGDSFDWQQALQALHDSGFCSSSNTTCRLFWGDARYTVTKLPEHSFDLVFLDAFSTQRNSELWTVDFFNKLRRLMKPDAVLLTYCAAIPVRAGLMAAGFHVGETEPVGRQRSGTLAALNSKLIERPLPDHERRMITETTRGLPYRDPHGVWTNKEILRDRQEQILKMKQSRDA
ncbi:MAG: TIGR01212 family radical SAM protein [Pontiellaceae bacterium]|nr:TIGR01212 family radical SAM protein [Pontiellaceae bacterium]MBN2785521.1 TIGR01212 family radical SAM protein [Pontiellaceae bacterium]